MTGQFHAAPGGVAFGKVITAGDVRAGVKTILTANLPAVLTAVVQQHGLTSSNFPPPRGYGATPPPDQLAGRPVGVIVAPGIIDRPKRKGNGLYEVRWEFATAIVSSASSKDAAQQGCELYAGALRACILQHPGLNGIAESTVWTGESTEEIEFDSGRSVWAATEVFEATVVAAVDGYATAGPDPVIQTQHITVEARR